MIQIYKLRNSVELVYGGTITKQGNRTPHGFIFRGENTGCINLRSANVTLKIISSKGQVLEQQAIISNEYTVTFSLGKNDIIGYEDMRIEFIVTYPNGFQEKFPSDNYQKVSISTALGNVEKYAGYIKVEQLTGELKKQLDKFKEETKDNPREGIQNKGEIQTNVGSLNFDSDMLTTGIKKSFIDQSAEESFFSESSIDEKQERIGTLLNLGSNPRELVSFFLDRGVNVKDCGAVGDWNEGTTGTDDSAAFQRAIDRAYELNTFVYIPPSRGYKISNTLITRSGTAFIGQKNYNGVVESKKNKTRIITYTTPVFRINSADINSKPRLILKNIAFTDKTIDGAVLVEYKLESSYIEDNFFYNYLCIINNGTGRLTYIQRNNFLNVRKYALNGDFVDSFILNNYINMSSSISRTAGIYCTNLSMTRITGNFIDFGEIGIRVGTGEASSIMDNIIDYCYRGIYLNAIRGCIIGTNTFNHTTKVYASYDGRVPTPQMITNDWVGIYLDKSITGCTIFRNIGTNTDLVVSLESEGYKNLKIQGNLNADVFNKTIRLNRKSASWFMGDGENLEIEDLSFKPVQTLPSPTLTGSSIVSFDNQVLYINGHMVRNVNGLWRDTNNEAFGFSGPNILPKYSDPNWIISNSATNKIISIDGNEFTFTTTGAYQDSYWSTTCSENEKYLFITDTPSSNNQGNRHLIEVWYYGDASNIKLGQSTLYVNKNERIFITPLGCTKFQIRLRGELPGNTYTYKKSILIKYNEN